MDHCRAVKREFTAWCDGELSRREAERVERHLAACAACAAEAESLRAAIRWQRQALRHVTAVADQECAPLQGSLRRALAAEIEPRVQEQFWSWIFRPLTIATAAATIAIIVLFSVLGGPDAVLIPLGVEAPPVAISSEPELFENYQLIQHLDAMENFDTVESVPLDEDQGLRKG
jgi:anti-sigma factor RsiW